MDAPADLLDQPREIGRRIGAACGYSEKTQGAIAKELGRDARTLRSYIAGKLGDYSTRELRLGLIRRIEEITECPSGIFGLSEPEPEADDQVRRAVAEYGAAQTAQSKELAALRKSQEETLKRVERLERGQEGFGN